jgi:DNA-binding MarR family transcriptional regulator
VSSNPANHDPEVVRSAAQLGVLISQVFLADGNRQLRALEESGASMLQVKILLTLLGSNREGRAPTGGEIAEQMGVSSATVSRAIDGLVETGRIDRREDPADRRRRTLTVTDAGRQVIEQVNQARIAGIREFVARLSEEERELLDAATGRILQRPDMEAARLQCQSLIGGREDRAEGVEG